MKIRRAHLYSTFFVFSFGLIFGAVLFFESNGSQSAISRTPLYTAQYSDQNITENAKLQNPQFKRVAFASSPKQMPFYPDNVATIFRAFDLVFAKEEQDNFEEHGTWVWTPILQMTPEYMSQIISGAKKEQVNVIYLSIDSYLDIFVMPDGQEKIEAEKKFVDKLQTFIWLAHQENILVDAEAGWRNWAEEGHTYKPFAIVEFVKKFNLEQPLKFRGFQYDVEPYLLEEYKSSEEGQKLVLANFTKLIDDTVYNLENSDLKFTVVVPDFYDKKDELTPSFEYKGKKDFAFKHLLRILEERKGSAIIIMSYRNFAEGRDGSIDISKNEMRTARSGRYSTDIILAQETGYVPEPYVTFYNTSKGYFVEEVGKLRSAFSSHRNFAGLAIHYANAYLELE